MKIGVVACSAKKLSERARAKDLYCSHLFRLSRAYVERECERWVILSAKHHVLSPDRWIAPYNRCLGEMSRFERGIWSVTCQRELKCMFPGDSFVVLAGSHYLAALEGLPFENVLAGMGIGQRIQWLMRATETTAEEASGEPGHTFRPISFM